MDALCEEMGVDLDGQKLDALLPALGAVTFVFPRCCPVDCSEVSVSEPGLTHGGVAGDGQRKVCFRNRTD